MKNARRVLSMVLCVLMVISMLTAIVLPVSAETTETITDPYAKVTTKVGTKEPTENVVFVDPNWTNAPKVDENNQFEYKYVGNGKTYKLTWGVNAFATITDLNAAMKAYSEKWVADPENVSGDFVAVFAPGEYDTFNDAVVLSKLTDALKIVTTEDLLTVYMLGAKAGKNPVSDARDTKADASVVQNSRSINPAKESVLTGQTEFASFSNIILDGFAGTKNASIGSDEGGQYINLTIKNYFMKDLTAPKNNRAFAGSDTVDATTVGGNGAHRKIMWEFENCYLDFNQNTSVSSYDSDNFGDRKNNNVILSNKIIFDNCYISNTSTNDDFKFYLAPERQSAANMAPRFYGDYAENPEITFKNSIVGECVSSGLFIFDNTADYFTSYSKTNNKKFDEGQVKINFVNNKVFDAVSAKYSTKLIQFTGWVDGDDATNNTVAFNCTGNLFTVSKERESQVSKDNYIFDFSDSDNPDKNTEAQFADVTIAGVNVESITTAENYSVSKLVDGVDNNGYQGWYSKTRTAYVSFDLGETKLLSQMTIYARNLATCYDRFIKEYEVYINDTAPTYVDRQGSAPTNIGTLIAEGEFPLPTASTRANSFRMPNVAKGRYVTLYIKSTHLPEAVEDINMDIAEVKFYGKRPTSALLNHFTIKDNVFKFSNKENIWLDPGNSNKPYLGIDLSGNLFVDNNSNVSSAPVSKNFSEGYMNIQSDLYVSAAMKGGVRETLSVKDIKDGALLYNYIQLSANGKNFLGATTILLERGKEYVADKNLFTFGDDKVVFEGVYSNEACTQKVEKLTQDMFANNTKYFLKASYSEAGTKASVVYALNSPMEYVVVTPAGSSYNKNQRYIFNGKTYKNNVKADDGVTAKFFTDFKAAIDEVDTTLAGEQSKMESGALAMVTSATALTLDSVILVTPGVYEDVGQLSPNKTLAIVGPRFSVSPYDAQRNANGELPDNRALDSSMEALIDASFNNNFGTPAESAANLSINGIVWTNAERPLVEFTSEYDRRWSDYQVATLKNCIFATPAPEGVITTNGLTEDSNLAVDIRVQDCVYYQPDTKRDSTHLFVDALAYRKVIDNFAVISQNCWVPGLLANDAVINNTGWITKNDAAPVIEGVNLYYVEHEKGKLIVDEPASCATEGKGHYNCNCGEVLMEADVVIPASDHTPDKLIVVDTKPTCNATGIGHKECTVCEQVIESNIVIPADESAHIWEAEYTIDEAPTCVRSGVKSIHCEVCDTFKPGTVVRISKVAHTWEKDYTVDTASTCTVKGVESIHCAVCDAIQEGSARELPLKAHVWETEYTIDKEPSCSAEGSKSYHCKDCDTILKQSVTPIEKTQHVWNSEATVDTPATCTKDGSASYHCKNCDATKDSYVLPATGHGEKIDVFVVIPTYQKGGVVATVCEVCGTEFDRWDVEKLEGKLAYKVFKDVEKSDWFYKNDSINFVYNTGLMQGTGKATFSPDATLTRGMFVTILGRLHGVSSAKSNTKFTDIKKSAYYSGYIAWASKNGIVSGTSATTFAPNAPVTREQICAILYRYCNYADITLENVNDTITFKDANKISSYAKNAVTVCQRSGLVNGEKSGSGYTFRPKDTASRAEAATIIRSLCYKYIIK